MFACIARRFFIVIPIDPLGLVFFSSGQSWCFGLRMIPPPFFDTSCRVVLHRHRRVVHVVGCPPPLMCALWIYWALDLEYGYRHEDFMKTCYDGWCCTRRDVQGMGMCGM